MQAHDVFWSRTNRLLHRHRICSILKRALRVSSFCHALTQKVLRIHDFSLIIEMDALLDTSVGTDASYISAIRTKKQARFAFTVGSPRGWDTSCQNKKTVSSRLPTASNHLIDPTMRFPICHRDVINSAPSARESIQVSSRVWGCN